MAIVTVTYSGIYSPHIYNGYFFSFNQIIADDSRYSTRNKHKYIGKGWESSNFRDINVKYFVKKIG